MNETDETINVSSDSYSSEGEDGPTPAKRRRNNEDSKNLSFKKKVQNILENLTGAAPGEFAVSGKLSAPITTIAIKVKFLTLS